MSHRIDPGLIVELEAYGLKDAHKCYNCGTCTAICDLATPENPFPRKLVRYIQLGQRDKLARSPEPWLCYYCGDCSTMCPRGAEPGETMMAVRRYLTAIYDWTGLARKFYTSKTFEIAAVSIVALLVGLGMIVFRSGPADMQHAALNSVWPAHSVEKADLVMAAVLSFFLLTNVLRCASFVMGDYLTKIPIRTYASEIYYLLTHFLTQKQFGKCKDGKQWFVHLMIMTGYASIFLMVVVLLNGLTIDSLKFQRDWPEYPIFHPIRLIGYYATFAIMYGTTYAIIGRPEKEQTRLQKIARNRLDVPDPASDNGHDRHFRPFRSSSGLAGDHLYVICGSHDGGPFQCWFWKCLSPSGLIWHTGRSSFLF